MAISNPSGNYIDKITLPTGTEYVIVDAAARTAIDNMASYSSFLGVVSNSAAANKIEDQSTKNPVLIGTATVTATTGSIIIYKPTGSTTPAQEFIWDGSHWNFFGDIGAQELGDLAYKDSATGTYIKFSSVNTGSNTVTSTGSYTPAGSVTLTKSSTTLAISSTSVNPGAGNTANYWIYAPSGSVSVTSSAISSSSATFLKSITGRSTITSITTAAPTTAAPTGGITYANVSDHNLNLAYLVSSSANAISNTSTGDALISVTKPTYYGGFSGSTEYIKPLSVTVTTAASFGGTSATITVNSSAKFVNSVTSSTANATVTVQ